MKQSTKQPKPMNWPNSIGGPTFLVHFIDNRMSDVQVEEAKQATTPKP
jgi:hypothetical protein